MPRATLQIKSNESLVTLSEAYPETEFAVLSAWPVEEKLRVLIEASSIAVSSLEETLSKIPTITDTEIRHAMKQTVLFEVSTPTPPSHGAMAESESSLRSRYSSKTDGLKVTLSAPRISSQRSETN